MQTWREFVHAAEGQFGVANDRQKARDELARLVQKTSVEDYAAKFRKLTILLIGFRLGRRGWARRRQVGAGASYVRPGHGCTQFLSPGTLGQLSRRCVQGGPPVGLAPLGTAVLAGSKGGRLFRLSPRSPLYLVSLRANLWHNPEPQSGSRPPAFAELFPV